MTTGRGAALAVRLHYTIDGDGPPLIIQAPAWGPSSDYLRLTLAPLVEGRRVLTYDPRNVGRSGRVDVPDSQAVDHLVDDLEMLRIEVGFERFVLLGHSHGGFASMAYAIRHPGRLNGLILLNTNVRRVGVDDEVDAILRKLESNEGHREAVALYRQCDGRLRNIDSDSELARRMRSLMPAYFYDLEALARFGAVARQARPPSVAALAGLPEHFEGWVGRRLGEITVPTLVATGRYDPATPPSASRRICERVPNCRLEIFEESGHHPWIEEPEDFSRLLGDFLDSVNEARPGLPDSLGAAAAGEQGPSGSVPAGGADSPGTTRKGG